MGPSISCPSLFLEILDLFFPLSLTDPRNRELPVVGPLKAPQRKNKGYMGYGPRSLPTLGFCRCPSRTRETSLLVISSGHLWITPSGSGSGMRWWSRRYPSLRDPVGLVYRLFLNDRCHIFIKSFELSFFFVICQSFTRLLYFSVEWFLVYVHHSCVFL